MIMGIFSKSINSEEYEKLSKKITDLAADVEDLKKKFAVITTNMSSLRGLINRRIGGDQDVDDSEETKGLNNPVILPENGSLIKHR